MSFADAVRTVLIEKYADFNGRARRSEYWWFVLLNVLVNVVVQAIARALDAPFLIYIAALALLIPGLAVLVRRLHDIDKSGWWVLLGLIPLVGAIILIVWACGDSKPDNQYGPNPKGAGQGAGYGQQPGYGA